MDSSIKEKPMAFDGARRRKRLIVSPSPISPPCSKSRSSWAFTGQCDSACRGIPTRSSSGTEAIKRRLFDLWAEPWRRHEATDDMILMRYADDIVVGSEHEQS